MNPMRRSRALRVHFTQQACARSRRCIAADPTVVECLLRSRSGPFMTCELAARSSNPVVEETSRARVRRVPDIDGEGGSIAMNRIMPTTWLCIAIMLVPIVHFMSPVMKIISMPYNLLGLLPLGFGIAINVMVDKAFHRAQTAVKPFEESTVLVTNGVFRMTRNPMYLGFVSILLGICILLGSLGPLAVVVLFAILMDRAYIRPEQEMLANRFGGEWDVYRKRVRRW
ncbi:MAG: hypothetical protein GF418_14765 [Chitinivibrionales bacterium]|nr:hypothetical protein [Chitinivibrionales bacterium]MBD3396882.1 hypothetical protein [Chitinivibrionales bacterium]